MYKKIIPSLSVLMIVANGAWAQVPGEVRPAEFKAPWIVSVIYSVDVFRVMERLKSEPGVQVGIRGSAPTSTLNVTTGLVIDGEGHIVTRLASLDPKDQASKIFITTSDGSQLRADLVGIDCATGFAVLRVGKLKTQLPTFAQAGSLADGTPVKMLSTSVVKKRGSSEGAVYVSPTVSVTECTVSTGSFYSKARGAVTLRSPSLLSRSDSSVVMDRTSLVVGLAQFAGFGRAYLYPIDLIRNTIVKRVLEKQGTVPAGWLGIVAASTPAIATPPMRGVPIAEVQADSPAAKAGLKPNDVVVGLDNFEIRGISDLSAILSASTAGRKVQLRAMRDSRPLIVDVELTSRECTLMPLPPMDNQPGESLEDELRNIENRRVDLEILSNSYRQIQSWNKRDRDEALAEIAIEQDQLLLRKEEIERQMTRSADNVAAPASPRGVLMPAGFTVLELTTQLANYFKSGSGVIIISVNDKGPAAHAGLRAGDCIVGVVGYPNMTPSEIKAVLLRHKGRLPLKVIRQSGPLVLELNNPARGDGK